MYIYFFHALLLVIIAYQSSFVLIILSKKISEVEKNNILTSRIIYIF